MNKKLIFLIVASVAAITIFMRHNINDNNLPVAAIANYGPHASLAAAISGFKEQLAAEGFVENKTIRYEVSDVGFDPVLIPQMLASLKAKNPKVLMVMTTPVAQMAKGRIHDIPLIYNVITDPVEACLIKNPSKADANMTGCSDQQDLGCFLQFAKSIFPKAKTIGLLYAMSETNDAALVKMMRAAASRFDMEVMAVPVEEARDVPLRVQQFKNKVDFLYVGTSGPIQPALPAIAAEAHKMRLPVFNVESQAVKDGLALASFGVNYVEIGRSAGKLAAAILSGKNVSELSPVYPSSSDHHGVLNKKIAAEFNIQIPMGIEVVE